jgi:hypothetical protein
MRLAAPISAERAAPFSAVLCKYNTTAQARICPITTAPEGTIWSAGVDAPAFARAKSIAFLGNLAIEFLPAVITGTLNARPKALTVAGVATEPALMVGSVILKLHMLVWEVPNQQEVY